MDVVANCRWTLRRAWRAGPSILFLGANPSYADGARDDPTILREMGFAFRWGFGSLVKVNWRPFITPKPAEVKAWLLDHERSADAMKENLRRIAVEVKKVDVCVAAWGALIGREEIQDLMSCLWWEVTDADRKPFVAFKCLGVTESGAPKHTLARGRHRIPDDATLIDWPFEFEEGY